ncbi:MAG: hypothetical protein IMZ61_15030 [Planctomycetes bacterium]|nr:hypothetical protein [Planctomycetota bacterium]
MKKVFFPRDTPARTHRSGDVTKKSTGGQIISPNINIVDRAEAEVNRFILRGQ